MDKRYCLYKHHKQAEGKPLMAGTDPLVAWATAARDEELRRYREWYEARYPRPQVTDCEYLHSAFGPGCPHCMPRRAAS